MAPIPSSSSSIAPLLSQPSLATLSKRLASLLHLHARQTTSDPAIVPTTYGSINSGPSPGTVVGIVLGSVGGFILLIWLLYTCLNVGRVDESTEEVVVRDKRKKRSSRASARSRRVSETVEVRRAPSVVRVVPPPAPPPVGRVVVEERREVRREQQNFGGSDEIVVIEDHEPPRKSKSKKERRSRDEGGYRTVDPQNYGGVVGGRRR